MQFQVKKLLRGKMRLNSLIERSFNGAPVLFGDDERTEQEERLRRICQIRAGVAGFVAVNQMHRGRFAYCTNPIEQTM
jgi:hypothetical protein